MTVENSTFVRDLGTGSGDISEEYRSLNAPILSLHRRWDLDVADFKKQLLVQNGWTPSWQVAKDEPNPSWLTYALKIGDWFPPEATTKFPRTMELLRHPACYVAGFSLFRPLSVIGPHAHGELDSEHLILHLGLDVEPGKSFLMVDGTFLEERNGETFIFDGSHEHFAVNASTRDRAILYLEFDTTKL